MGLARELERRLERLVDGATAAVFRGRMHPVDMADHLVRGVDFMQQDGATGPTVPNRLVFRINPADLDDTIDRDRLGRELANAVSTTAAERGWKISGPITVTLALDPSVPRGLSDCSGTSESGPLDPWAQLVSTSPPQALDVGDNQNVLGRAHDSDIVLSVPEVSRHHALIVRRDNEVLLSDFESANGTKLNGTRLDRETVAIVPGDQISFGDTEFTFRLV
jgi:hypothetical protein